MTHEGKLSHIKWLFLMHILLALIVSAYTNIERLQRYFQEVQCTCYATSGKWRWRPFNHILSYL